jgi:hypothetical protein
MPVARRNTADGLIWRITVKVRDAIEAWWCGSAVDSSCLRSFNGGILFRTPGSVPCLNFLLGCRDCSASVSCAISFALISFTSAFWAALRELSMCEASALARRFSE